MAVKIRRGSIAKPFGVGAGLLGLVDRVPGDCAVAKGSSMGLPFTPAASTAKASKTCDGEGEV